MARILVADDNPLIRRLYADELEGEGYEVVVACDGDDAIKQCRDHAPDVVVLDIGMPEKSGLEALGEIAAMHGGTAVIVNTAYPLFKLDYRAHRAVAWVEKSSNLGALKEKIREVLSGPAGGGEDEVSET